MNWERWSAGRLAAQNRLFVWKVAAAQGCGTRRHVKDPDSVPGNPEQTGGGGSHEDSGSFCGVFFQRYTLDSRRRGLRREQQTEMLLEAPFFKVVQSTPIRSNRPSIGATSPERPPRLNEGFGMFPGFGCSAEVWMRTMYSFLTGRLCLS